MTGSVGVRYRSSFFWRLKLAKKDAAAVGSDSYVCKYAATRSTPWHRLFLSNFNASKISELFGLLSRSFFRHIPQSQSRYAATRSSPCYRLFLSNFNASKISELFGFISRSSIFTNLRNVPLHKYAKTTQSFFDKENSSPATQRILAPAVPVKASIFTAKLLLFSRKLYCVSAQYLRYSSNV